jgi:DUF1680 family protein
MLLVTGKARYADLLEQTLYNSVLSGVSLDGSRYFYTNPLRASRDLPFTLRWSGGREEYIRLSNCCPPNLARTLAEVSDYMYSLSDKGLWFNLYGGNHLSTRLADGSPIQLSEQTEYPWDGKVTIKIETAPAAPFSFFLRIPGWCQGATLSVNGKPAPSATPGEYVSIHRKWMKGDLVTLNLPMPVVPITSNPLVEETRGQVALRRGPVVYCLESPDLPALTSGPRVNILDVAIPAQLKFHPLPTRIGNSRFIALEGEARQIYSGGWKNRLYQPLSARPPATITIHLIPYYAWANRGPSDMTVWMELAR